MLASRRLAVLAINSNFKVSKKVRGDYTCVPKTQIRAALVTPASYFDAFLVKPYPAENAGALESQNPLVF